MAQEGCTHHHGGTDRAGRAGGQLALTQGGDGRRGATDPQDRSLVQHCRETLATLALPPNREDGQLGFIVKDTDRKASSQRNLRPVCTRYHGRNFTRKLRQKMALRKVAVQRALVRVRNRHLPRGSHRLRHERFPPPSRPLSVGLSLSPCCTPRRTIQTALLRHRRIKLCGYCGWSD